MPESSAVMKPGQEYEITDSRKEFDKDDETPRYMEQLSLDDETSQRLSKEIVEELDAIKEEYKKESYDVKWASLENQYEGKQTVNENQMFNLHRPTTKVKCDTVERFIKKAYLEIDPKYSMSPRPDFAEVGQEVCERQEDYIDYKLDNEFDGIAFSQPLSKVVHNAVVKNGGILAVDYDIEIEQRKREETYEGTPVYTVERYNSASGEPYEMEMKQDEYEEFLAKLSKSQEDGELPEEYKLLNVENRGLDSFLSSYPDARDNYPGYVKKLENGKTINISVDYEEVVYNDPRLRNVSPSNFYVRTSVEGYQGLRSTKLICERRNYTWWDLKREEAKPGSQFKDIDRLIYEYDMDESHHKKGGRPKRKKNDTDSFNKKSDYKYRTYDILQCTYYFKLKETDEEERKIQCWIDEESEIVLGALLYPYYGVSCNYIPFFISDKWDGFWQQGLAEYMTDMNLAENLMLNYSLEAVYMRNTMTPITKNAEVLEAFLEKDFTHGVPLPCAPNEVDFLQKYMANIDTRSLIAFLEIILRAEDDVSGVSAYTTGKESEIDPNAPASKTIALMRQSGLNIEEFIKSLLPSFNKVADILLQMTYQMAEEGGRKYRPRPGRAVKGEDPFGTITRDDMKARTNIQSQAMSFAFDELNAKREWVSLLQLIRGELGFARHSEAVWFFFRELIKSWSPKFRNIVDKIWPPFDKFKAEQQKVAVEAVTKYMQAKAMESQATGQAPELNPMEIVQLVNDMTSEQMTPASEDTVKEREKQAEGGM